MSSLKILSVSLFPMTVASHNVYLVCNASNNNNQVIETKHCMKYMAKTKEIKEDKYRLCYIHEETIQHIISGYPLKVRTEYKERYDKTRRNL